MKHVKKGDPSYRYDSLPPTGIFHPACAITTPFLFLPEKIFALKKKFPLGVGGATLPTAVQMKDIKVHSGREPFTEFRHL